ncbi:MAG: PQQ-binding-like beta-propeller repeat protein [Verrucomicrobia bacterium]|nr:PQQ-binding-like beta-propeller repeat protein [Verrucomicrobiota bacterium]
MNRAHTNFRALPLLIAALLTGFSLNVPAADKSQPAGPVATENSWPMFRGNPSLTGVAPGKLADKLSLLWTFKTGGPTKSSAAIADGKVFIGGDDQKVYALDFATGTKVWEFKTEGPIESSPLVLGATVYIGSGDGKVYALSAKDGTKLWEFKTEDKILGAPNWVKSDKDGRMAILVGSYDFKLYSLDAATGKSNWVYETGNYINGSPAVLDAITVFGGCDAVLHVVNIQTGEKVKEIDGGAYIAGSVALADNRAYYGHYENEFLCVDLLKEKTAWTFKDRAFPFFASPAVIGDKVIIGGRDKRVRALNRASGKEVWSFPTQGKVDSSPVVVDGKVVVGSEDGRLYMLSLKDGKELWSHEIGQGLTSSPAVASGKVVIGSEDGSVYCFGVKK